jgi:hypothetical protein
VSAVALLVIVANGGLDNPRGAAGTVDGFTTVNLPTFLNGSGSSWQDVAYSPSLETFVAVSSGGDNHNNNIAKSVDGGATFAGVAAPDTNTWTMNGICWSPDLGLFCIVTSKGPTTATRVLTSPDADTWTEHVIPDVSKNLNSVCWSHEKSLFVAVGDGNAIYTSPNGSAWTARTGPATSKDWLRVTWAGGTIQKFCAIANNGGGSNDYMYSSDGITWTQKNLSGSAYAWQGIGFSIDLNQLIVVGGNTGVVVRSGDGVNWTQNDSSQGTTPFKGVVWSGADALWYAVGTNVVRTSADGQTWVAMGTSPTGGWNKIASAS